MMDLRRAGLAVALVLVAVLAVAGSAVATQGRATAYETTLKMSAKFPAFHGKAKSDRKGCTKSRKVRVYKQKHGRDKKLGADVTDSKGRWKVKVDPLRSGAYYAKTSKASHGGYRCKAAKSNVVTAD